MDKPADSQKRSTSRRLGRIAFGLAAVVATLWCFGAIYFDAPFPGVGNTVLAVAWLALTVLLISRAQLGNKRRIAWAAALALVILPWLFKRPSNDRHWAPEYARTAGAVIDGDAVTFTNFRNFDYAKDGTVTERWETRTFHLSNLRGIDFFLNYWGSPLIAHPIFSFDFGEEGHAAFSIETRREKGETFTTLGGLFKLYELTYLVGDERDFIRVRTNVRENEDAYLFRLNATPEQARIRLLEYVEQIRRLEHRPRFYNVVTANCTTAIRSQITTGTRRFPDWRLLLNGKLDEMFAERDLLAVPEISLPELKQLGHVDPAAMEAHDASDFSRRIRHRVPGFD